jgi:type 1 glutamine amidotransferase
MGDKIKVLLIGDDSDAAWHPLQPARQELEQILGSEFELTVSADYNRFAELCRDDFALCISYTDCWNRDLTSEQTAGLLRFVAGGGGLLAIHNGISLQRSYELLQVIGGKFVTHPPYQPLKYYATAEGHPLLDGVEDFTVDEEPYMFEFASHTPRKVFLEFEFEGTRYPAAWEHTYGLGKVVYLQPGHCSDSFKPASYRKLVLNSARWAAGL